MSGLGPEVRKRTDALDALGNTTAATGKGFAIGSAALTALALLASYIEEIRIGLIHNGVTMLEMSDGTMRFVQDASILDFMEYYRVSLMNPTVLIGVFIGAMMSFLFCGLTMNAVGRAAQSMVEEVRRQFREIKGILTGEGTPDYARCVAISTRGAQREMLFPSLLAIAAPVVAGLVFGVAGVMGLLVGGLSSGFVLAVFMANAGGAWDNAKKMVEEGHFRRQGFRLPPGHGRGRYGRRSLQGYVGSVAQHSHQTDVDGRDRDGGAYGRLPFILIFDLGHLRTCARRARMGRIPMSCPGRTALSQIRSVIIKNHDRFLHLRRTDRKIKAQNFSVL